MSSNKPRVIKDYKKLDRDIQEQIKLAYPYGYSENLITFSYKDGQMISALPFETDDRYYLVKMSIVEAEQLIKADNDYAEDGSLKQSAKDDYSQKHADVDYLKEAIEEEEADERKLNLREKAEKEDDE